MKTVWKFQLPITDSFTVAMPKGAKILKAEQQGNIPCLWALVNSENTHESRSFVMRGTGYPLDGVDTEKYIGTFLIDWLVFHLFEVE